MLEMLNYYDRYVDQILGITQVLDIIVELLYLRIYSELLCNCTNCHYRELIPVLVDEWTDTKTKESRPMVLWVFAFHQYRHGTVKVWLTVLQLAKESSYEHHELLYMGPDTTAAVHHVVV